MKRMPGWRTALLDLTVLAALALMGLAACQPRETELPFQTIAEGPSVGLQDGRGYPGEKPDLLIITAPEQVDTPGADVRFGSDLAAQLRAVDYSHNTVIVVFQGLMSALYPSYAPDILGVARRGDSVVIRSHFGVPGPEEGGFPAFSSPYHIIAVPRQGMQEEKIRFILEEDGQVVKERTYFIP
jgi:hypothetical protein